MNGFIDSFYQFFTCSKDQIGKRFKETDTENILMILLKIIEENIIFDVSMEIEIHVLDWLESFSTFLKEEIELVLKPFLSRIFRTIFYTIIKVLTKALKAEDERIKKKIVNIHSNLQAVYNALSIPEEMIYLCATEFQSNLSESSAPVKVEVVLKWLLILSEEQYPQITENLEEYMLIFISKICDRYHNFVCLLENSIIIRCHFDTFIRLLFKQMLGLRSSTENIILGKILCLSNSDRNFITIVRCLNELPVNPHNNEFKCKVADILFSLLVCNNSLSTLRDQLRNKQISSKVLNEIYYGFLESKGALIGLCFFLRKYQ